MKFTKLEGHSSLFSSKVVSADQMTLVNDIIKANGGPVLSRKSLKAFHLELRGKKASPYFIAKNVAAKKKNAPGMYDLSQLREEKQKNSPSETKKETAKPKAENAKPKAGGKKKQIEAPAPKSPEDVDAAGVDYTQQPETL